jgi:formylglycine-generating enzyme required for sulfatase activity
MARGVADAPTDDFAALVRLAGINPKTELRFGDFAGVSLRGADLRGFDLSGANLRGADFVDAQLAGARFHGARIDGARFDAVPVGAIFQDAPYAPEMVVVPSGEFTMGSNDDEEKPPHRVAIEAPFAVGRFAVTFAEWDAAGLAHKPGDEGWGRGRRPVINVSWEDAQAYASWLSQQTGKTYRLLSEAEWEYCCRAGTTTRYAFGDNISTSQAHFGAESTVEVGKFQPNAWGLYDMHGNVLEWVEDNWHPNYQGAPTDGSVWPGGDVFRRVLRGGAWYSLPDNLRSAFRNWSLSDSRNDLVGFRVARTL